MERSPPDDTATDSNSECRTQILLLSPPLSYPIPLLSLTTHLALLSTRLPALKSELDEDPLFNDDWEASTPLYPRSSKSSSTKQSTKSPYQSRPPITLLVMAIGPNILFDPTREELTVADAVLAVSITTSLATTTDTSDSLQLLSIRTIDPPSRLTTSGIPDAFNSATGGGQGGEKDVGQREGDQEGVWRPPRGGMKRGLVGRIMGLVFGKGGVGEEVLAGLEGVDVG